MSRHRIFKYSTAGNRESKQSQKIWITRFNQEKQQPVFFMWYEIKMFTTIVEIIILYESKHG